MYLLDSHALTRSIETIKRVEPDFVEVLPGIATKAIKIINEETNTSVIAGGLINDVEEVMLRWKMVRNISLQAIGIYGNTTKAVKLTVVLIKVEWH